MISFNPGSGQAAVLPLVACCALRETGRGYAW